MKLQIREAKTLRNKEKNKRKYNKFGIRQD